MDVYSSEYYVWNTRLLSAIGTWPYELSFRQGRQIFVCSILLFGISTQLGGLQEVKHEFDAVLKSISYILITIGLFLKYGVFLMARTTGHQLLDSMKNNWKSIMNAEELEIMTKYALKGKFHTVIFALLIYPAAMGVSLFPFGATILDIIFPLNQTRPRDFPTPLDLIFFNRKKHFWCTVLVVSVTVFVMATAVVATETISIQCLQHSCALLEITSRRIKVAFQAGAAEKSGGEKGAILALFSGIEMHKRSLDFYKFMKSNYTKPYLILLGLGVLSLTIHLFCLSRVVAGYEKIEQGMSSLFLCLGILGYMFYLNYMTQEVIDKSAYIFIDLYDGPWYEAPIVMQKLLIFIMLKSVNVFTFDIFGIFNPSIEGFAMITRLSVSYLMVLQSFQ